MNNSIKNLIFDLDGCLIDSTEAQKAALFGAYKEVVGDSNYPSFPEYIKYTGDSLSNIFRMMGLPQEMIEPYRLISRSLIDKITVNEDCISLIREMKSKGSKIAICTGKDHLRTEEILNYYHIYDLFDAIVASDDVTEPKPSAMPLLMAIDLLSIDRDSCIYIGDGMNDLISAKRAKIPFIFAQWYTDSIEQVDANIKVTSVEQLYKYLNNI